MPGPGLQSQLTVAEMLQALSRQRATGVLTVQGQEGWKVLELQAGSIAIVSGTSGTRIRLGEILCARGKISQEVLARALASQRASGAPLGDILVQRGFIARQELEDIIRFQLEEEIYDLFTWKGATASFEAGSSLGDQMQDYPDVAGLAIDPQGIFVEAAKRIPVWRQIERNIYSAHAIYRLSERGQAMLETATRGGRKLLALIQQDYCVDTVVRKAMVGRFAVWKAVSDLADAQAIAPVADAELTDLASRWEREGKLEQAWGAYSRLSETTTDARRATELQGRADALRQQIRAAEEQALLRAAGGGDLGAASSRYRIAALAGLAAVVLIAVGVLVARMRGSLAAYNATQKKVQKLRDEAKALKAEAEKSGDESARLGAEKKLAEALRLWDDFLVYHRDGDDASYARTSRQQVQEEYDALVETEMDRVRTMMEKGEFGKAKLLVQEIPELYRLAGKRPQMSELTMRAENEYEKYVATRDRDKLAADFERGRDMLAQKRYGDAKILFETVIKAQQAGTELRQRARKEMKVVEAVEARAKELWNAGQAMEGDGRLDEATTSYRQCVELWFDSEWGREAERRREDLTGKRARAEEFYRKGLEAHSAGDSVGAQMNLRRAAGIRGFKVAELASQKLKDLASESERVAELLERRTRLRNEGKPDEAFATALDLADRFPNSASALDLKLEILIETVPSSARVFLDDRELGRSPITARIRPRQSGNLLLKKPGFHAERKRLDRVRQRVLRFNLQKKIAYRVSLGQPVFSSPVPGRTPDARTKPQVFVHAGPLLAALGPDTGEALWDSHVEIGAARVTRAHPAVLGEMVFVVSGDRLRGYSLAGAERLDMPVGAVPATSPIPVQIKLLANRTFVILACEDGTVVSLDVLNRERRWGARVGAAVRFDLAANERAAFVPAAGGSIVALDILDGSPLWTRPLFAEAAGDLVLDEEGELIGVVTGNGDAVVLSAADGQERMRVQITGVRGGAMTVGKDTAYVGSDDGRVRAIDIGTSVVKWSVSVEGAVRDGPTVHGGNVYVGTEEGRIVCVDATAGRVEWSFDAEAPITASGAVCEGVVVFGTHDGDVIGIQVEGPAR